MTHSSNEPSAEELTLILREMVSGKDSARPAAMARLVDELGAIARGIVRHLPADDSLNPSALVNETYLKLFGRGGLEVNDRMHFFALAAKAMRQILVDHARKKRRVKRDAGFASLSISLPGAVANTPLVDVLDLHTALEELAAADSRQGQIVELRYFGGLEIAEVARIIEVSTSTVEREWRFARAWLRRRMEAGR